MFTIKRKVVTDHPLFAPRPLTVFEGLVTQPIAKNEVQVGDIICGGPDSCTFTELSVCVMVEDDGQRRMYAIANSQSKEELTWIHSESFELYMSMRQIFWLDPRDSLVHKLIL